MILFLIHETGYKKNIVRELFFLLYFKTKQILFLLFPDFVTTNNFYQGPINLIDSKNHQMFQVCSISPKLSKYLDFDISSSRYPLIRPNYLKEIESSVYLLDNLTLYGRSLTIKYRGSVLKGINPERRPFKKYNDTQSYDLIEFFNLGFKFIEGYSAIVVSKNVDNYFHFLFDFLPKLLFVIGYLETVDNLVVPKNNFIFDILKKLNLNINVIYIDSKINYVFQESIVPSLFGTFGLTSYNKVNLIKASLASNKINSDRLMYVSRKGALSRRLINENKLFEKLKTLGFEFIDSSLLSVSEQIELFSECCLLISPHGAGLSNMVFMPEGSNVIEFFALNRNNDCYYELAKYSGLNYNCIFGNEQDINFDYEVDIETVLALVKHVLERR
jgi:hypothetical protein